MTTMRQLAVLGTSITSTSTRNIFPFQVQAHKLILHLLVHAAGPTVLTGRAQLVDPIFQKIIPVTPDTQQIADGLTMSLIGIALDAVPAVRGSINLTPMFLVTVDGLLQASGLLRPELDIIPGIHAAQRPATLQRLSKLIHLLTMM